MDLSIVYNSPKHILDEILNTLEPDSREDCDGEKECSEEDAAEVAPGERDPLSLAAAPAVAAAAPG